MTSNTPDAVPLQGEPRSNRFTPNTTGVFRVRTVIKTRVHLLAWYQQISLLWFFLIIWMNGIALASVRLFSLRDGYDPASGIEPFSFPGVWMRWDANYYLAIATDGYAGETGHYGFFPLYPIAARVLSDLTGFDSATVLVALAHLFFLISLLLLYKVAMAVFDCSRVAMATCISFGVNPLAFFFVAAYAETVLFSLGLLAVYLSLLHRWFVAGVAAGLAAVARPTGVLFLIILVWQALAEPGNTSERVARFTRCAIPAGAGIALFPVYLYLLTGSLTAIPDSQNAWLRTWDIPVSTLLHSIRMVNSIDIIDTNWFVYASNLHDLVLIGCFIALIVVAMRRLPASFTAFSIIAMLFLLSQRGPDPVPVWGIPRWSLIIFPVFLAWGSLISRPRLYQASIIVSWLWLTALTAWWVSGRWVA